MYMCVCVYVRQYVRACGRVSVCVFVCVSMCVARLLPSQAIIININICHQLSFILCMYYYFFSSCPRPPPLPLKIMNIKGKWSQNPACSRLEFGRPMCMATVADDTVYIVGGVDHRSGKRATGECIKLKPSWGPSTPIPAMIHERASCGITTMYYNPARITLPTASCEERVQIDKASAAASAKERAERAVDEHNGVMKEHVCMRNPKCKKQNKHTGRCKIREDDDAAPTSAPNKRAKALPAVGSFPAKQGAAAGKGTGHTA